MSSKIFTGSSDTMPDLITQRQEELWVYIGAAGHEDFGGGTVKIQKVSGSYLITLKEITSLASKDDRAQRFKLPGKTYFQVSIEGATDADLFVEVESDDPIK